MPLEVECHTVPHLKALTRGIEHWGGRGEASKFRWQKISLKNTHFTSQTFDRICICFQEGTLQLELFFKYLLKRKLPNIILGWCKEFHGMGAKYFHVETIASPLLKIKLFNMCRDNSPCFFDICQKPCEKMFVYQDGCIAPVSKYWWVQMHPLYLFCRSPCFPCNTWASCSWLINQMIMTA